VPLLNYAKIYGPDLAPLLRPYEQVLDMARFSTPLAGDEGDFERPEELMGRSERWIRKRYGDTPSASSDNWVGFDPIGGVEVNQRRLDRLAGGESAAGSASSLAAQLLVARKTARGRFYLVTDQRFALVGGADLKKLDVVFQVPRSAVASARREPKPLTLQMSRVVLNFADGSRLACLAGFFLTTSRAKSLVAALAG
jgi:hypothetical protein